MTQGLGRDSLLTAAVSIPESRTVLLAATPSPSR